ncbi:MAG: S16 family serine protease [Patescibacteria group bacterium]
MADKKTLIENRVPVINVFSVSMPTPVIRVAVHLSEGKSVNDLFDEIKAGNAPLVLCVMSVPGIQEVPKNFFKVGVVCEPTLEVQNNKRIIFLKGSNRARMLDIQKHKNDPESFWSASIAFFEEEDQELFLSTNRKQLLAKLFKIKHLFQTVTAESSGIWPTPLLAPGIQTTFEEFDFGKYEELEKFIWMCAAAFPEVLQEDLQPILESTSLLERIDLCIGVLKSKLEILRRYKNIDSGDGNTGNVVSVTPHELTSPSNDHPPTKPPRESERKNDDTNTEDDEAWVQKAHPELKKRWGRFKRIRGFMSESAQKVAREDFRRLHSYGSPENSTYSWPKFEGRLDLLLSYPWGQESKQEGDIDKVMRVLDEDHFGLATVKRKICDQIAPRILNPGVRSQIMCFVGPQGVGKTSLAMSVARALGLKRVRISVGGLRDETQIKGHGITYIGSQPGEIIREMVRAGTTNPVFIIDEVDKIGQDSVSGNPGAALLEVLDPEQNFAFKDRYTDCGIDLSKVLFIATANDIRKIIPALRDRMDVINLHGYLESEKVEIAKRYLIPRWTRDVGLEKAGVKVEWDPEVVPFISRSYTREIGVRNLERSITTVLRRLARRHLESKSKSTIENEFRVDSKMVIELLGPEKFIRHGAESTLVGEAIGLAWTPVGGEILRIQVTDYPRSPDKKSFARTGMQGKVMMEADEVAFTIVKRTIEISKIKTVVDLNSRAIHLHIPEGATPKDGPSAGLPTIFALYSQIVGLKVKDGLATTGEIDAKSRVKEVGGIREKVEAADRAGLTEVMLPEDNRRSLFDVPDEIKKRLKFHFVRTVDEALAIAFAPAT